ncbi:PAS domain-containing sensor histidine kinase [Flammeovirga sp. EKP202]|uniref:PAS domain-containing sensor histidine kinase n=1 Tax=Flammeovirga sp. EKP202 TaxID=2770592 RepID=UPI00165FF210|nr:PAS domain-containing sensor histidine kinase [Flammeovirga sp. EKP202]MBD0400009.1 PAS domain-containing sensor histidine kinase [Flammeovirga sp. EKP202]
MHRNNDTQTKQTIRYYNLMYAIALSVIAIISIVSQLLIQSYLGNQLHDTHLINFATRLRSNSQSLTRLALLLESERSNKTHRKDFQNILMQLQKTHESLQHGNEFLNIPENHNVDMIELFNIIENPYKEMIDAAWEIVNITAPANRKPLDRKALEEQIDQLLISEKAYFLGMEMIVFDYDRISRKNVIFLKKIELYLLASVIILLLLEAYFIFRPLAKRIRLSFEELTDSEKNARALAREIKVANNVLEKSHQSLRDINFTLEKATYFVKIDTEGNIIYANDKYCNVTKYEMSGLLGRPLFYNDKTHNENIIYDHIKDPIRRNEVWQGEIFDQASDGTDFWLEVTLMPMIDSKGQLYQFLVIGIDITKRKKTEQELHLLMKEKLENQKELKKVKLQSMVAGQEKERKRVAVEIHDGIGQMLTSLRMKIEMLEEEHPIIFEENSDVDNMIRNIIGESRRICGELLPSVLEDFGLKSAIEDLVLSIQQSTNLNIQFIDNFELEKTSIDIEMGMFRILQESLNNVMKHAHAENVSVILESDAEFITMEIVDDGVGFNYSTASLLTSDYDANSYGLANMKERAELLGAKWYLESQVGKGTHITLEVPILD